MNQNIYDQRLLIEAPRKPTPFMRFHSSWEVYSDGLNSYQIGRQCSNRLVYLSLQNREWCIQLDFFPVNLVKFPVNRIDLVQEHILKLFHQIDEKFGYPREECLIASDLCEEHGFRVAAAMLRMYKAIMKLVEITPR